MGADFFVEGAEGLALRYNISLTIIGITVVAFGTSLPELLVSIEATLTGTPDIAMGNVVGSNIANIGLILGLSAIFAPATLEAIPSRGELRRTAILVFATLVFGALTLRGVFDILSGIVLIFIFVVVMVLLWRGRVVGELRESPRGVRPFLLSSGGLLGVVAGAHLLLIGAEEIALQFQIPPLVIGLSLVAIGTSLPELATSFIAIIRGSHGISVGNILGSNIFNLLFILGSASLAGSIPVPTLLTTMVLLGFSLTYFPVPDLSSRLIRIWGVILLLAYLVYMVSPTATVEMLQERDRGFCF